MKTLKTTIAAMMIMLTSLAASAQPMSVYAMRNNARFLTDRMAYTLGLSAALIDDLYYINYDYICGVNDYLDAVALGYRYDDYMEIVYARDYALRRLLTERQWALLMTYDYFYRPIAFNNHRWSFSIYLHDRRMDHFFFAPHRRFNDYRGGTVFGGMRRVDVPGMRPGVPGPGAPSASGPGVNGPVNNRPGDRLGDNRMGDMRGEVIRPDNNNTTGNDRPYHIETPGQNRGNVSTPTTVNRSNSSTVTSFPGNAGRTTTTPTTPNTRTGVVTTPTTRNSMPTTSTRTTTVTPNTRTSVSAPTTRTSVPTPSRSTSVSTPTTRSSVSAPTTRTSVSAPTRSASSSASRTSGGSSSRVSAGRR